MDEIHNENLKIIFWSKATLHNTAIKLNQYRQKYWYWKKGML